VSSGPALGLAVSGPAGIIEKCFARLGLIRFYTVKGTEKPSLGDPHGLRLSTRPDRSIPIWPTFHQGRRSAYSDLLASGDFTVAREHGRMRVEGKTYVVRDGDVIQIKFRA